MKKRYYLSMLSLFPLILAFECVYFVVHQSTEIFLVTALGHFVLFGLINFLGAYFLYKPIDHIFIQDGDTEQAKKRDAAQRINRLTWYSTGWIFFLGSFYVALVLLAFFWFPTGIESHGFSPDKVPPMVWFSYIPSIFFFMPSFLPLSPIF